MEEGTLRPLPPNPCTPSPCGPNSQCQVVSGQAQCGCVPNMIGSVPNCRPECVLSSDCPSNSACINQKCVDPCPGTCAQNADCRVVNHSPVCNCATGYTGDAFSNCRPIPAVGKKRYLHGTSFLSRYRLQKKEKALFFILNALLGQPILCKNVDLASFLVKVLFVLRRFLI